MGAGLLDCCEWSCVVMFLASGLAVVLCLKLCFMGPW